MGFVQRWETSMPTSRHKLEEIAAILRQIDVLVALGIYFE
jgi:hypothetical protein